MSIVALLVFVVVLCVVVWAVRALMAAFGIGEPIATVVYVVMVLIILLALYQALMGGGVPSLRLR